MHILCGRRVSCGGGGRAAELQQPASLREGHEDIMAGLHTDLVETTLVREDGDVPVVACTSYMTRVAVSKCTRGQKLGGRFSTHQT